MTNKQRVATHEAGHVVAAVQLGIPVVSATIEHGTPHFMRGRFRRNRDTAIEHLCLICLAGPASEEVYCDGPIPDFGCFRDFAMARSYIADAFPLITQNYQFDRLKSAAKDLVRTPWAREGIRRLSDALLARTTIHALDIYDIVASERPMKMLADLGCEWV
jgi:hypothetical protein